MGLVILLLAGCERPPAEPAPADAQAVAAQREREVRQWWKACRAGGQTDCARLEALLASDSGFKARVGTDAGILAQVCRIWGQLLESKVGLLDAVQLTQDSTRSLDFRELLAALASAITEGQSIGGPMLASWLVPKTFSAAIATGEESGKLGEPHLAGNGFARIGEGSGSTNVLTGSGVDEAWTTGVQLA
ncbi:MAG TPA: type II secretion system F family protein, partial [Myxococcota bacterium]|nr:type II secretion system F family protein [Myxococcota bacterium]